MKRSLILHAIPIALSMAFITIYSASALGESDLVNIRADSLEKKITALDTIAHNIGESYITTIDFVCKWSLSIENAEQLWEMKHPYQNTFPVEIIIDGTPQIITQASVPYGERLGGADNALYSCGYGCSYHAQYEFSRTFKNLGKHTVKCLLNTPKMFSDRNPNDNSQSLAIDIDINSFFHGNPPIKHEKPKSNTTEIAVPTLIPFSHNSQKPNMKNYTQDMKTIQKRKPLELNSQPERRRIPDTP